jgi:hypothetical protein
MDLQDSDYVKLLKQIDDLKKVCEKLQLDVALLEIPMQGVLRVKSVNDLESSSSESGHSS